MEKLRKCIFILKLLKQRGKMTREEICSEIEKRWQEDLVLSRSTFGRYITTIKDYFYCKISFSQVSKQYYLEQNEKDNYAGLLNYLLSMYETEELTSMILKHKEKIHHIDAISGTDNLRLFLQAIDQNYGIRANYRSFQNDTQKDRVFIPIFLTTWEGRWYCIAEVTTHPMDMPRVYALERFLDIVLTNEHYKQRYKGSCEDYFLNSYGIQGSSNKNKPILITLKANKIQSEYLRMKPLHQSQRELNTCEEDGVTYTYFNLYLVPCYNFYQQLLWQREAVEIISPESIRIELANITRSILSKYENNKNNYNKILIK